MRAANEQVVFRGGTGAQLTGALHLPPDVRGGVLLAHCFTCGKDLMTMTRLAKGLTEAGFALLRFDFTGLGASEGAFSDTTLATSVADIGCALGELGNRCRAPLGMVGHSYGGAAAILAAERLPAVRSVAVLGAPSRPTHLASLLREREGRHVAEVNGRTFPLDDDFVADLRRHDTARALAALDRPLLVLHALDDTVVPPEEGEALFAAAVQPKAFMPLLAGGHLLTDRQSAAQAVRIAAEWFDRTL
jgi:pimeloyl-ACP methyl ester carboxylesterase